MELDYKSLYHGPRRLTVTCGVLAFAAYISLVGTNIDFARTYAETCIKCNSILIIPIKLFTIWHDVGESV
jgi:hypothetical protein